MESLHNSNEFVIVVLLALVALVGGDVHLSGIVHEHAPRIRLHSNQQLDEEPHV